MSVSFLGQNLPRVPNLATMALNSRAMLVFLLRLLYKQCSKFFPDSKHGFCVRHLYSNFQVQFKGKNLKNTYGHVLSLVLCLSGMQTWRTRRHWTVMHTNGYNKCHLTLGLEPAATAYKKTTTSLGVLLESWGLTER